MVNMYQDKEIIEKTKELVKTIKEDNLYKEYIELRHELKSNKKINNNKDGKLYEKKTYRCSGIRDDACDGTRRTYRLR